jgi:Na+(H+)/acetate symporter ActP
MDPFDFVFPAFFLLIVGIFAFRFIRHGSLTGALLGGHIIRTVGEVSLSKNGFSSRVLKVQIMEAAVGEKPSVALSIISKALFAASVVPLKLTAAQAQELTQLLQQASGGRAA